MKKVAGLVVALALVGCASTQEEPVKEEKQAEQKVDAAMAINMFAKQDANKFYFDFAKADVKDEKLAKKYSLMMKGLEDKNVVVVSGYCDKKGSDKTNNALGEKRAQNVAEILKENGVKNQIKVVSNGKKQYQNFVADQDQNDQLNRKVQILVK